MTQNQFNFRPAKKRTDRKNFIFAYTNFRGQLKEGIKPMGHVRYGSNFFYTLLGLIKILERTEF